MSYLESVPDEVLEALLLRLPLDSMSFLCCASPVLWRRVRALPLWSSKLGGVIGDDRYTTLAFTFSLVTSDATSRASSRACSEQPVAQICSEKPLSRGLLDFVLRLCGASPVAQLRFLSHDSEHSVEDNIGLGTVASRICSAWGPTLRELGLGSVVITPHSLGSMLGGCPSLASLDIGRAQPAGGVQLRSLLSQVGRHDSLRSLALPVEAVPPYKPGRTVPLTVVRHAPLLALVQDACSAFPALETIRVDSSSSGGRNFTKVVSSVDHAGGEDEPPPILKDQSDRMQVEMRCVAVTCALYAANFSQRVKSFVCKGFDTTCELAWWAGDDGGEMEVVDGQEYTEVDGGDDVLFGYRFGGDIGGDAAAASAGGGVTRWRQAAVLPERAAQAALVAARQRVAFPGVPLYNFWQACNIPSLEFLLSGDGDGGDIDPGSSKADEDDDFDEEGAAVQPRKLFYLSFLRAMMESGFPDEMLDRQDYAPDIAHFRRLVAGGEGAEDEED